MSDDLIARLDALAQTQEATRLAMLEREERMYGKLDEIITWIDQLDEEGEGLMRIGM